MKAFFGNPVIVFLALIVFPPLGIFFMYRYTEWKIGWKRALAVIFCIIWIVALWISIQQEISYVAQMSGTRIG